MLFLIRSGTILGKPGTVVAGASWPKFGVFHMRLFSSLLLFSLF